MKNLALGVLLVGLLVACSEEKKMVVVVTPDATRQCSPLTNRADGTNPGCPADQKCTWLLDALMPNYVGHIGCAPNGTANVGEACMYGAPGETGFDDCKGGSVCSNFRGTGAGFCKQVCDQQGGMPACDQNHVCVIYSNLFDLGETTPAAAGVCNVACNPFNDNDYDGAGSDFTRTGTTCGSAAEGCYGSPSYGTPPVSGWSCTRDIHYGSNANEASQYVHRTQCIEANGCADAGPKVYQNSCSQGYLPLLIESTGSTTTICVAFCQPENCYMGNCGTNNVNRLGKAPHRCNFEDRLGSFDGVSQPTDNGEHCEFLWRREIDNATATYLPSQWSDTVGFCYDHSKYRYDSDNDTLPDMAVPACAALQDGFGSGEDPAMPLEYFGAADLGCVDSTRLMGTGKTTLPESAKQKLHKVDMPRPLYNPQYYQAD